MGIYYLDADDEITSAASRIRDTSDSQVALVLTAGSRVATSRINFMLLAREARKRNKRLSIVTSDPSTQSVARSAELEVYGTVGEYERALSSRAASAAAAGMAAGTAGSAGATGTAGTPAGGRGVGIETSAALGELARTVGTGNGRGAKGSPSRTAGSASEGRRRVPWPVVAAVLATVIVLVSGSLFFLYPSATVALTLAERQIGPISLNVTVDPAATAVDDASAVIPGLDKAFPLEASGSYQATGQQIDETAATGTVTFSSINTLFSVPVVAGTQVSTRGGVAFLTTQTVNVPAATVSGTTIRYGTAQAPVQAVIKGTDGNVPAGSITRLPSDLVAAKVSVSNPAATIGGTHNVTPAIAQADVDAAATDLLAQLDSRFKDAMAAPGSHPSGTDLFADTARMSVAVCSPDPAGLIGLSQDSFQLTCKATGTATVADLSNVKSLAERRIKSLVDTNYSLVESSVQATLGSPSVHEGTVEVPVSATASQVRKVNTDQIRSSILGKSLSEARSYLQSFGSVSISLSPGWADKLPSFDFRIDFKVAAPTLPSSPSASASGAVPTPTSPPTPQPVATIRKTVTPITPAPTPGGVSESPSPSASPASPTPGPAETPTATPAPTPTPPDVTPTPSPTPLPSPSSTP